MEFKGFMIRPVRPPDGSFLHLEAQIERSCQLGTRRFEIGGTTSPSALALLISQAQSPDLSRAPHLVVTSTEGAARQFIQDLQFYRPASEAVFLPAFDVSPYSGLSPRRALIAERCRFLWLAQSARPGQIFVASIEALLQKTLPFEALNQSCWSLKRGGALPVDLSARLDAMGFDASPLVEDVGQYAIRGGIVDIFSPAHPQPLRMELFGDEVHSLRFFDPSTQRSFEEISEAWVIPCSEAQWGFLPAEDLVAKFRAQVEGRPVAAEDLEESVRALSRGHRFEAQDFQLNLFYKSLAMPLDHFSQELSLWLLDPVAIEQQAEQLWMQQKTEYAAVDSAAHRPDPHMIWAEWSQFQWPPENLHVELHPVALQEFGEQIGDKKQLSFVAFSTRELSSSLQALKPGGEEWVSLLAKKLHQWKSDGLAILFSVRSSSQAERLRVYLEHSDFVWKNLDEHPLPVFAAKSEQQGAHKQLHFVSRPVSDSLRIPDEGLVLIRDEDLFGRKTRVRSRTDSDEFQKQAQRMSFGDLKPGDCVVHSVHGIGIYDGLKLMSIGGADSEFIQISYKDKDKLYLPVYRIGQLNRYSGLASAVPLDRLGSNKFEQAKSKVRSALRDLAGELLQLYARRAEVHREPLKFDEEQLRSFEAAFPYDETDDQLKSIQDILRDFKKTSPMDRLICGDVGFGKTEVAMRAAFAAVSAGRQVAVLCPTTVLSFQHLETFRKRFKGWPVEVQALNRFVSPPEQKKILKETLQGKVQILIGTHRLLSKDVQFSDLGLLIVDEEQKFGVLHKEKIRKLKTHVDTLAMSATPIPRTLNLSLVGIRDLSLINTAPVDRLPTRTFISKWDPATIQKAVEAEVHRGGQVYFIHNRVQTIYRLADELRAMMPHLRLRVGHGQMEEEELEKTMVSFFHHEIDILVCTTIVESGMDVPAANTMFIDQAQSLGLSQLYQLRGRVGRSKQRAYCYLLLPKHKIDKTAEQRLKVIQENTALGSGIRIAQYDLELRGAGNILGEEQSGHIDAVGYELYMELLQESIQSLRGEATDPSAAVDPEINLRIPALIPYSYIGDIRLRLAYYKALADVRSPADLDNIEAELKDQFGPLPEATVNLMGLMLIRSVCRELGVRDLSAGLKNISLLFDKSTRLTSDIAIRLATQQNKKYSLTPDSRLNIRMNEITWSRALEELEILTRHLPAHH